MEMRASVHEFLPVRPRLPLHLSGDRLTGVLCKLLRLGHMLGVFLGFDVMRLFLCGESCGGVLEQCRVDLGRVLSPRAPVAPGA
ncbi:hypothetical protein GCM10009724_21920 [Microbacterium lacticum]|nr:hypothetical protein GCM10009724_21920 [Microbacterium lacticum]